MEKVRALCQDSDIEIRKLMANEVLEKICFSIGSDKTEIYLLEKVFFFKNTEIMYFLIVNGISL